MCRERFGFCQFSLARNPSLIATVVGVLCPNIFQVDLFYDNQFHRGAHIVQSVGFDGKRGRAGERQPLPRNLRCNLAEDQHFVGQ